MRYICPQVPQEMKAKKTDTSYLHVDKPSSLLAPQQFVWNFQLLVASLYWQMIDKCTIHKQMQQQIWTKHTYNIKMSGTQFLLGTSVHFRVYQKSQASQHTQNPSGWSLHTKLHFGHTLLSSSSSESVIVSFATLWYNGGGETHFLSGCFLFVFFSRLPFSFFFSLLL